MTTLAATLTDFSATLKRENDRAAARAIDQSPLSPAEIVIAAEIAPQTEELWAMYRKALSAAQSARTALKARMRAGVPSVAPLPDGGFSATAAIAQLELCELIDKFADANRRLYDTAQTLVDCPELEDDGEREGVEWGIEMAPRRPR